MLLLSMCNKFESLGFFVWLRGLIEFFNARGGGGAEKIAWLQFAWGINTQAETMIYIVIEIKYLLLSKSQGKSFPVCTNIFFSLSGCSRAVNVAFVASSPMVRITCFPRMSLLIPE